MTQGATLLDRTLVYEDFADKVGEVFTIREDGVPAIALELTEATPLNPAFAPRGARPPFSLLFVAEDPRVLPQRIYRMAHQALGDLAIFIVPVGKDAQGVTYQATFN